MRIDHNGQTPKSFWSYQAPDPKTYDEALACGAITERMTPQGWESLTPGMRREIVRSHLKRAASA